MDETILTLLNSRQPADRRRGLAAAARSGDQSYIPILVDHFNRETDAELKALFRAGALYLKKDHLSVRRGIPARSNNARRLVPFLLFSLVVVLIGVGVIWAVASPMLQTKWAAERWTSVFASAASMPDTPVTINQPLNGAIYNTRVSALTTYYVVEPSGLPTPRGWPILMVLHGWMGNGWAEIPTYADEAARAGILLVAPTFDDSMLPTYEMDYRDLREILRQLKARYVIDQHGSVITGFSWGARVAEFYSVTYPQDYGGTVIGGVREYLPVPPDSQVRYAVFIGANDFFDNVDRPRAAKNFVADLAAAGKPAWYFEVVSGVGHERVPSQVEKTFELISLLRNSAS